MHRRIFISSVVSTLAFALSKPAVSKVHFPINTSDVNRVPSLYKRRIVSYIGNYEPGAIVVDTHRKFLYLVQAGGKALRYGIGVGKQGFSWSGDATIKRKAKWPRWTPPAEMVERDPLAAEWADGMPGGPDNPLGARALYLFQGNVDTLYRIHGTAIPASIGKAVSSGCIRLLNADVVDLYERVPTGTRVVVLQNAKRLDDEGRVPKQKKTLGDLLSVIFDR
jgi:lipoprotein-anchoring transpeptidase ErfK/SrfK